MRYVDAHVHLTDSKISGRVAEILSKCRAMDVCGVISSGIHPGEWSDIAALTEEPIVYGAAGVHPFFIDRWMPGTGRDLRKVLISCPKMVAVGEIGLDFSSGRDNLDDQVRVFSAQLSLACSLNLPVILHNRKSWEEFFRVLKDPKFGKLRGMCHCFTGSRQLMKRILDRGLLVSLGRPLTYENARRTRESARYVPQDRVLTETDSPNVPGSGHRGKLSMPFHVKEVLHQLAHEKNLSPEETAREIEQNFKTLFGISGA